MTKEDVKKYIDNYILHIVRSVEYGNLFADDFADYIKKAKDKCKEVLYKNRYCSTKKICKQTLKEIKEILHNLQSDLEEYVDDSIRDVIENEDEWININVANVIGEEFNPPKNPESLMKGLPIATVGLVGMFGESVASRLYNLYEGVVQSSYITGSSVEDIYDDYEPRFNNFDRGVKKESETVGQSLSSQYDRIVYTKNDNKIQYYIWISLLDSSTCLYCGSLSGKRFDDINKAPLYPPHFGCRCQLLICNDEIAKYIPEDYEHWFEEQPKEVKKEILGKNRFQLYENGMKIKSFVNNGKITPLKDLKK